MEIKHIFDSFSFSFCFPSGILKNENGVPEDEENFEEAIKNVNTALNPTKVPDLIPYNKSHPS